MLADLYTFLMLLHIPAEAHTCRRKGRQGVLAACAKLTGQASQCSEVWTAQRVKEHAHECMLLITFNAQPCFSLP